MIDSHAHILREFYSNIDKVVTKNRDMGLIAIINCADCIQNSFEVIEYSKIYSNFLYCAIGIHPEYYKYYTKENMEIIEKLLMNEKIIAVGEIGLDYYKCLPQSKEIQKQLFESQIKLAIKYNKPVIVHSREAIQDTYDILSKYNVKGVIHCFTGSYEMAMNFIKRGFLIGIGGVLTFNNSNLYKVVQKIDIENIILETDSPFLSPEPLRGQKNEPMNVRYVAKKIAKIKGMDYIDVIEKTNENVKRLFDLDI